MKPANQIVFQGLEQLDALPNAQNLLLCQPDTLLRRPGVLPHRPDTLPRQPDILLYHPAAGRSFCLPLVAVHKAVVREVAARKTAVRKVLNTVGGTPGRAELGFRHQ